MSTTLGHLHQRPRREYWLMHQNPNVITETHTWGRRTSPSILRKVTSLAKDLRSPVFLKLLFKTPWYFLTVELTGVLGFGQKAGLLEEEKNNVSVTCCTGCTRQTAPLLPAGWSHAG